MHEVMINELTMLYITDAEQDKILCTVQVNGHSLMLG